MSDGGRISGTLAGGVVSILMTFKLIFFLICIYFKHHVSHATFTGFWSVNRHHQRFVLAGVCEMNRFLISSFMVNTVDLSSGQGKGLTSSSHQMFYLPIVTQEANQTLMRATKMRHFLHSFQGRRGAFGRRPWTLMMPTTSLQPNSSLQPTPWTPTSHMFPQARRTSLGVFMNLIGNRFRMFRFHLNRDGKCFRTTMQVRQLHVSIHMRFSLAYGIGNLWSTLPRRRIDTLIS